MNILLHSRWCSSLPLVIFQLEPDLLLAILQRYMRPCDDAGLDLFKEDMPEMTKTVPIWFSSQEDDQVP